LQPRFQIYLIGGDTADRETRPLIEVLVVGLNHQDLVSRPDLFRQATDRRTLCLETARLWHMQLQVGYADKNISAHPLIPVPRAGHRRVLEFRRYFDEPEGFDPEWIPRVGLTLRPFDWIELRANAERS